jgi:predicted O-methyltransferase YrrM
MVEELPDIPDYILEARGWLKPEERKALVMHAREAGQHSVILNIGVEYGASLACLRYGAPLATLHGVDLNVGYDESGAGAILHETDSALFEFEDRIDVLFIDGDHSRIGVAIDARFATQLNQHGVVIFHDCYDWGEPGVPHKVCPGVNQAVDDWFSIQGDNFQELEPIGTMRRFRRIAW